MPLFEFQKQNSWPDKGWRAVSDDLERAGAFWDGVITGGLSGTTLKGGAKVQGILVVCSGRSFPPGLNALTTITERRAAPAECRAGPLPKRATLELCENKAASLQKDGYLLPILKHELGHALGVGALWKERSLVKGSGSLIYCGRKAGEFFCGPRRRDDVLWGVPVDRGLGSPDNLHWSDKAAPGELMAKTVRVDSRLGELTLRCLEDLGYTVDPTKADWTPPARSASPEKVLRSLVLYGLVSLLLPDGWPAS